MSTRATCLASEPEERILNEKLLWQKKNADVRLRWLTGLLKEEQPYSRALQQRLPPWERDRGEDELQDQPPRKTTRHAAGSWDAHVNATHTKRKASHRCMLFLRGSFFFSLDNKMFQANTFVDQDAFCKLMLSDMMLLAWPSQQIKPIYGYCYVFSAAGSNAY